jgi:hypothetical protein
MLSSLLEDSSPSLALMIQKRDDIVSEFLWYTAQESLFTEKGEQCERIRTRRTKLQSTANEWHGGKISFHDCSGIPATTITRTTTVYKRLNIVLFRHGV